MAKSFYKKSDYLRQLPNEPFEIGLEPEAYRDNWRRDFARLIHSPSFRRLQGKTQLFPGVESDFFRNRLTHSMEVAQIAKSIAIRINHKYNKNGKSRKEREVGLGISTDLVEFAGLAHDLGHPPFGHQGEEALDACMIKYGGFEGNAQTIRLLTKIEKKFPVESHGFKEGKDDRVGLNLSMRTIASILKYDREIPEGEENRKEFKDELNQDTIKPVKGYYKCDRDIVQLIKESVADTEKLELGSFKTIECTIMDIADDIAYSTYDLEDGFKAGFISPMDLLYPPTDLLRNVTKKVNHNLIKEGIERQLEEAEIPEIIGEKILRIDDAAITERIAEKDLGKHFSGFARSVVGLHYQTSKVLAQNGSIRVGFTSSIVGMLIRGAELIYNEENPSLSKVVLCEDARILVEILKTFTYMSQITSPRLKIAEFRGKEIVSEIFRTLSDENKKGYNLLPDDIQNIYLQAKGNYKKRIICDYVSSMTDRYAIEFYGRLKSENPETIFKPF